MLEIKPSFVIVERIFEVHIFGSLLYYLSREEVPFFSFPLISFLPFLFLLYLHIPSLQLNFLSSFTLMLLGLLCCEVGKIEKLKTMLLFMIKREADIQRKHLVDGKKKVSLDEVCGSVELNVTLDSGEKINV